jgi:tetratricopeptide (TPR) repeat protein
VPIFVLVLLLLGVGTVQAQDVPGCGSLANAFGPFDYRDPVARGEPLHLVEIAHFTANVEQLVRGSSGQLIGDLDYTLRAFPNHHRALRSVGRYALSGRKEWLNPEVQSADCYFERAAAFQPDDAVVQVLYANYLAKQRKPKEAAAKYLAALQLEPTSIEINYNAGLFFLEQGDLKRAKELAQVAYDGGHPLPALRDKIAAAEARQRAKNSVATGQPSVK